MENFKIHVIMKLHHFTNIRVTHILFFPSIDKALICFFTNKIIIPCAFLEKAILMSRDATAERD